MFTKFIERLNLDTDSNLRGAAFDGTCLVATDGYVALWEKGGASMCDTLSDATGEKVIASVKKGIAGSVISTVSITRHQLWLLGKTLGEKECADIATIQMREWGKDVRITYPALVVSTQNRGMTAMPIRYEPTPENAPFLFWGRR